MESMSQIHKNKEANKRQPGGFLRKPQKGWAI
jgi:hypothetical protein